MMSIRALSTDEIAEIQKLLVLDTEVGSPAEQLYARLGYARVGVIPHFARNSSGDLHGTVLFYKNIGDA